MINRALVTGLVVLTAVVLVVARGNTMQLEQTGKVSQEAFCRGGLTPTPKFCSNDLVVITSHEMQPFGVGQEDDYTPSAYLEQTGYINPQTTVHRVFIQGSL